MRFKTADRFHEVAAKLASDDPTQRRYGWDEACRAYDKWIKGRLSVRIPQSKSGRATLGPGESASDIENVVWMKGANAFQKKATNFASEASLASYINNIVMSAVVESVRRIPRPAKFLPPQIQWPVDLEPMAPSGDRLSKADYWEQLYADIERRNGKDGKSIAALFSEWLRLWCEEKDWHRRWIVLSEYAKSELGDVATPDTIRVRMGRLLGRLQKDKGFCERFQLTPRSDSSPEIGSRETVIPDVLPDDPANDETEQPSDSGN